MHSSGANRKKKGSKVHQPSTATWRSLPGMFVQSHPLGRRHLCLSNQMALVWLTFSPSQSSQFFSFLDCLISRDQTFPHLQTLGASAEGKWPFRSGSWICLLPSSETCFTGFFTVYDTKSRSKDQNKDLHVSSVKLLTCMSKCNGEDLQMQEHDITCISLKSYQSVNKKQLLLWKSSEFVVFVL